ncbi:MAG: rhodanese-like domain-containing protein [candidate division NC10 bacterium]|nr:rhodanese-like domain-containing protein [candidate division NC10 bacterium]
MEVLVGCLLIGLLSLTFGLGFNFLRPSPLPLIPPFLSDPPSPQIDVREALEASRRKEVLFFDSRLHSRYKKGHLPRAMNLPPKDFKSLYPLLHPLLPPDALIMIYGEGWGRPTEKELAYLFSKAGVPRERIRILKGGFRAWEEGGYPVAGGGGR